MRKKSCLAFIMALSVLLLAVLSGCNFVGGLLGQSPTADAGFDGSTEAGEIITLDGSSSSGNNLEYSWRIATYPSGASTAITNSGKMIASYTPTLPGEYVFSLTVKNSYGSDSAIVRYVVSSVSTVPVIEAVPGDRQVTISWDPIAGATSYFVYYKADSTVTKTSGLRYSTFHPPYIFSGLDNGTQYAFIVSSVTGTGESEASAVVTATPAVASTAPNAPLATAVAGDGSVVVSWAPVSGATSYNLYYLSGSTVTKSNGDRRASVVSPYTVRDLTNNSQYAFIVTAINAVGESLASPIVTATPTVATALPAAPVATALAGDGMVLLSWAAIDTASSYYVYYKAGSSASITDSRISSATTSKIVTGLTNSTMYAFVVTAVNSIGEGAASNILTATPSAPTSVTIPSSPSIQAIAGDGSVSISWQPVSGAVSYNLYYKEGSQVSKTDGIPIIPIPTSSPFILNDLTNGFQYAFIVTAINAAGESLASNLATATPKASITVPDAPANPISEAGDGQVTISWTFVSNASSYNLYWLEGSTVTLVSGNKISGISKTSETVIGLVNDSTYAFVVTAVNTFGESVASALRIETPKAALTAPGAPNGVMATPDTGKVTLSWAQVNGATSYSVYYKAGTTVSTASYDKKLPGISTLSYPISELLDSSNYAFIVTANNTAGESAASAIVTFYEARIAAAKQSLGIGFASVDTAESVTQDLTLSTSGLYGTSISWASNTPATITNTGIVTRSTVADIVVSLTGTISIGPVSDTKVFTVIVVKLAPLAAPTVTDISPASTATGIAIATTVTATFSTSMDPATINTASFTLKAGTSLVGGAVSYNTISKTATFTPPASLEYSTTYTATVSTAVKDLGGTAMAVDKTWSFTTAPAPVAPTVTGIWPLANSTGFGVLGTITANFSTSMDPTTINADSFTLWAGAMAVPGTVSYSEISKTAIFSPTTALAYSTVYTATVKNTVWNSVGTAMVSDKTWTFTTEATVFVSPGGSNIRKGLLLVNEVQPLKMCYIYIDVNNNLYSRESSNGGVSWSFPVQMDSSSSVFDVVADIDDTGDIVVLWISGQNVSPFNAQARYNKKAFGVLDWDPSQIRISSTTGAILSPSVFRTSPSNILFAAGYGPVADAKNVVYLRWNDIAWSFPPAPPVAMGTDNVIGQQIYGDSTGNVAYLYADNHLSTGGWNSLDILCIPGTVNFNFPTTNSEYAVVEAPIGNNASQPYMIKSGTEYFLFYTIDNTNTLYYRHHATQSSLNSAEAVSISTTARLPNYSQRLTRTMYVAKDASQNLYVVWQDTMANIYRAKITAGSYTLSSPTLVKTVTTLDWMSVNQEGMNTVLYVTSHEGSMGSVTRIINP